MFVVTIDQRHSRTRADRVPELLRALAEVPTVLDFDRTAGDEVQGLLDSADAVVAAVLLAVRQQDWSIGIGVGTVHQPLPASSRAAFGSAFIAAREAVEQAKRKAAKQPLTVLSAPLPDHPLETQYAAAAAADAEAVLVLIAQLVAARSAAQWSVLDQVQRQAELPLVEIAKILGISHQAVSAAISRANWQEEQAARPAAAVLLERADHLAQGSEVVSHGSRKPRKS